MVVESVTFDVIRSHLFCIYRPSFDRKSTPIRFFSCSPDEKSYGGTGNTVCVRWPVLLMLVTKLGGSLFPVELQQRS